MYENLFSYMFHINLLQDTSTKCASVLISFFFFYVCAKIYLWMIYRCLITEAKKKKKNWEKLVSKCHEDHFSQQCTYLMHCGVDKVSITYCSILVICMPLTLHDECFIFAFRCRLVLLKSFFQPPLSVQMLLTLECYQQCLRVCL